MVAAALFHAPGGSISGGCSSVAESSATARGLWWYSSRYTGVCCLCHGEASSNQAQALQ